MKIYVKRFCFFLTAFSMVFNFQFPTVKAAAEADTDLASVGEIKQMIVYKNNSTEQSDLLGHLIADTVEVQPIGDRYKVEVSFLQGQAVQDFALSGAIVEQKKTEADHATKVYSITVDDLAEIQDATITLVDGTTQTVQMQFEGEQNPFGDIQELANYSKIVSLYSRGIFKESDQFNPHAPTTRYQFALMLYRALDIDVDLSQAKDFKDLNDLDSETVAAIKTLNVFGVINGVSADRFSPHDTLTRSQAARMIYRVLEKLGYEADSKVGSGIEKPFADLPNADEELLKATSVLNKLGIMIGYQGQFSPDAPLTRDQMSKVLYNSLEVEEVAAVTVSGKTTISTSDQVSETSDQVSETSGTEIESTETPSPVTSSIVIPNMVASSTETQSTETQNAETQSTETEVSETGMAQSLPPGSLNKVSNGTFEQNYLSSKNDWKLKDEGNSGSVIVQENDNHNGTVTSNVYEGFVLQKIPTTPGKTYTLEADVFVDSTTVVEAVYLTAKDSTATGGYGPVLKQLSGSEFTKGKWEKKGFDFTANSYETYVGIVKWSEQPNDHVRNSIISLDNISVREHETYTLVWYDEFNAQELDQNTWGYELGNIRGNEQQHYSSSKDNVIVTDGNLVLKVTDRPAEDQYRNTTRHGDNARLVKYNSGSVRTQGKQEFLYGRIEASMKLPKGKGVFPAFWTLGADFHMDGRINTKQGYSWPSTGEIDIMELTGAPTEEREALQEVGKAGNSNKLVHGTPHFYYVAGDGDKDGSYKPYELGGKITIDEDFYDDYHIFGINWSPDKIEWYVDDVVYNTMVFKDDHDPQNDARLKAAAASLNRAQYIQFNLATGGNFAGDAGDYLAADGTELKIDWVRWLQTDEQRQAMEAYYETSPKLEGTHHVTMTEGSEVNLLAGVTTDQAGYVVEYSIDNEFMFENTGAPGGRNEVTVQVQDSKDVEGLKNLKPGVYNIHYTALPADKSISGWVTPTDKLTRKTVFLTVLPENGLSGRVGESLGSVALPEGWEWEDATQIVGSQSSYRVVFRQVNNTGTVDGNERKLYLDIPSEFIK